MSNKPFLIPRQGKKSLLANEMFMHNCVKCIQTAWSDSAFTTTTKPSVMTVLGLTSTIAISDRQTEIVIPEKMGSRDLTTLNHKNSLHTLAC
jgi:hypothetical protein